MTQINAEEIDDLFRLKLNEDTNSFINEFRCNAENITICQNILEKGCSAQCQVFLSSTLQNLIQMFALNIGQDTGLDICDWCLKVLFENSFVEPAINFLSDTFGFILLFYWNCDRAKIIFNSISSFFDNTSIQQQICGLHLFLGSISSFSNAENKYSATSNNFGNKFLPVCYNIMYDFLNQKTIRDDRFIDLSLRIMLSCISYQKKENENISQIPMMREYISDPNNLIFFLNIYKSTKNVNALKCVQCFILTLKSTFLRNCAEKIYNCFAKEFPSILIDLTDVELKSKMALQFAKRLSSSDINQINFLIEFMNVMLNFTFSLFSNHSELNQNNIILQNLIEFWTSLSFRFINSGLTEQKHFLINNCNTIVQKYIEVLTNILYTSSNEEIFTFMDDLDLSPIKGIVQINPSIISFIIERFDNSKNQIDLTLFLKFISVFLILEPISSLDNYISEFWEPLFNSALNIINFSKNLIDQKKENPSLEIAIINFISIFKKTHFSINMDISHDFYSRLILTLRSFPDNPIIVKLALEGLLKVDGNHDDIMYLLLNHSQKHFSFLTYSYNIRNRQMFYKYLFILAFQNSKVELFLDSFSFDCFIDFIIDISSVCLGINNNSFLLFFDWYSKENIINYIEKNISSQTIILILKFFYLLIHKKEITFPENSRNGIILFKEIAKIATYSFKYFLESNDIEYQLKLLKRLSLLLSEALNNNFVIFQVFQIYKDDTLSNLLDELQQILNFISAEQIIQYPKISLSILSLLESLSCKHLIRINNDYILIIINFTLFFIQSNFKPDQSYQIIHNILDFLLSHKCINELFEKQFEKISLYFWEKILNGNMIIIKGGEFIAKIIKLYPNTISIALNHILESCENNSQIQDKIRCITEVIDNQKSLNDFYIIIEDIVDIAKQYNRKFLFTK